MYFIPYLVQEVGKEALQNCSLSGICMTTGVQFTTEMLILCNRIDLSLLSSSDRPFTEHYEEAYFLQAKKAGNQYLLKAVHSYSRFLVYLQSRKCHLQWL